MKLLDFLHSRDYDLRQRWIDKKTEAEINYLNQDIRINLDLVLTQIIAHEFLHDQYPWLSENQIIKKTYRYIDKMKVSEIKMIGRLVLKYLTMEG